MAERTDALAAASELVLAVEAASAGDGETLVGTVGRLDVEPGATNVIPGTTTVSLDVRDTDASAIDRVVETVRTELARLESDRGVTTDFVRDFTAAPTAMSERLRTVAHDAADRIDVETLDVHSGAFHDTTYVAAVTDAALLFAPSQGGVSHSPDEWTDWEDCATATAALAETVATVGGC